MHQNTMQELVVKLNIAARDYYSGEGSSMSDKEYDALYDELVKQEQETGVVLPDSPTRMVGYQPVSSLEKFNHPVPALSLDKTKEADGIRKWIQANKPGARVVVTPKCDGLTAVAYYGGGRLNRLVTRGNGYTGEDVTHNAYTVSGLPLTIPYEGELIVRGEVLISYDDFEKINDEITARGKDPYQNPRNLASGSLRLLDPRETKRRHLVFKAFNLANPYVEKTDERFETVPGYLEFLKAMCFKVVEYLIIYKDEDIESIIDAMTSICRDYPFATDGLVFTFYDVDRTLGSTGKYPKHSIAYKWADEAKETEFRKLFWSASKTGLLNPVAEFEPVEIEGTIVRRASIHNVSMLNKLQLTTGDKITVYKANMIIPQIDENLSAHGRAPIDMSFCIPKTCPVCGSRTVIREGKNSSLFLYCENEDCAAKHLGKFERLCSRDALNIVGVSSSALERFLSMGYLHQMSDIYHLDEYKNEIITMDGFGEKSYDNMISSINRSRKTTFQRLFYSLGIPGAGHDVAKILDKYFSSNEEYAACGVLKSKQLPLFIMEDLYDCIDQLPGIGSTLADAMVNWFSKKDNFNEYLSLVKELNIEDDEVEVRDNVKAVFDGLTFVVTGSLNHYANRNALKKEIESLGGKVSGSVSKKTDYLINNDLASTSGKNKKALELGIPIISEETYMDMLVQQ